MFKTHRNTAGELLVCMHAGPGDPPDFADHPEAFHSIAEYNALTEEVLAASKRDGFTDRDIQKIWDRWNGAGRKLESDDPAKIERATREMEEAIEISQADEDQQKRMIREARGQLPDATAVYAKWNKRNG